MFYLAICGIIAFLTGFVCSLFVFLHKPRNSLKTVWSMYSLCISLWGIGIFLFPITREYDTVLWISRSINLVSLFIPIFFFHFVLLLTGRAQDRKIELAAYYILFFIYALIGVLFPDLFVRSVSPKNVFNFYPDAGPIYIAFPVMFAYLVVYGLAILYKAHQKASLVKRNQYKYFFFASLLGISGGCTTFFLLFDIPIYPYGAIMVPVYNLMVVYIIIKHHLMDIRVVIRKSVIYTILISLLTVFYMAGIYFLERLFNDAMGYQSFMGSVAVFVVMAMMLVPLKNWIQSFVDRYFFKASYLQVIEENDLLRQQVLRTQRYETMVTLSRDILTELRNPLTTLVGYGHQLSKRWEDREFQAKFQEIFGREIDRIQGLVNRLSGFSSPKPLDLKPVDMISLMNEVLAQLEKQMQQKKTALFKYYNENAVISINADHAQIKQALYCFLVNALRSISAEGGQIWVGLEEMDGGLEIRIKDTGRGFNPEDLANILDLRISNEEESGVLSLSSAQYILNNHGGRVIVDSEPGVGTEWVLELPGVLRQ